MLKQVDGKWALVSKTTGRPLAYYKGEGKPSEQWVNDQEARIQYFKHKISEKQEFHSHAGAGEDASDELVRNYIKDTPGQKKKK